jgi:acetyltransferase
MIDLRQDRIDFRDVPSSVADEKNWLFRYQLPDGPHVRFRYVTPADAELVAASIRTVSRETLLHRFFSPINTVPISSVREMLKINFPASICLVGEIDENGHPRIICGARFVRASSSDTMAEVALSVHDDFQCRGLGTFLLRKLGEFAFAAGVEKFEGYVLYSNARMRRLVERVSPSSQWFFFDDVIRVVIPVETLISASDRFVRPPN